MTWRYSWCYNYLSISHRKEQTSHFLIKRKRDCKKYRGFLSKYTHKGARPPLSKIWFGFPLSTIVPPSTQQQWVARGYLLHRDDKTDDNGIPNTSVSVSVCTSLPSDMKLHTQNRQHYCTTTVLLYLNYFLRYMNNRLNTGFGSRFLALKVYICFFPSFFSIGETPETLTTVQFFLVIVILSSPFFAVLCLDLKSKHFILL